MDTSGRKKHAVEAGWGRLVGVDDDKTNHDTKQEREQLLRSLGRFNREGVERLAERSSLEVVLSKNKVLLEQGQVPASVYVIISGSCTLVAGYMGKDHATATDSWLRKPQVYSFKPRVPVMRYEVNAGSVHPGEVLGGFPSLFTPKDQASIYRGGILISDTEKEFRPATMKLAYSVIAHQGCVVLRFSASEYRQAVLLRPSFVDAWRREEFIKNRRRLAHIEHAREKHVEAAETEKWNMCLYSSDMESRARYRPSGFKGKTSRLQTEWEIDSVLSETVMDMGDPSLYDGEETMNAAEAKLTLFNKQINGPKRPDPSDAAALGGIIDRREAERVLLQAQLQRNAMFGGAVLTPELSQRATVKMAFGTDDHHTSAEARLHIVAYGERADKALRRTKMRASRVGLAVELAGAPSLQMSPSYSRTSRLLSKTHVLQPRESSVAELNTYVDGGIVPKTAKPYKVSNVLNMLGHSRRASAVQASSPEAVTAAPLAPKSNSAVVDFTPTAVVHGGAVSAKPARGNEHAAAKRIRPSSAARRSQATSVNVAIGTEEAERAKLLPTVDAKELSQKLQSLITEPVHGGFSSFGVEKTDAQQEIVIRSKLDMDAVDAMIQGNKAASKRNSSLRRRTAASSKQSVGKAIGRHGLGELKALNVWWAEHAPSLRKNLTVSTMEDLEANATQSSAARPLESARGKKPLPRGVAPLSAAQRRRHSYVGLMRRNSAIVPLALGGVQEATTEQEQGNRVHVELPAAILLMPQEGDEGKGDGDEKKEDSLALLDSTEEIVQPVAPFPNRLFLEGQTNDPVSSVPVSVPVSVRVEEATDEGELEEAARIPVLEMSPFYELSPDTRMTSPLTAQIGGFQKDFLNQSEAIQRALRRRIRPQSAVMDKFVSRTINADLRSRPSSAVPRASRGSRKATLHPTKASHASRRLASATRLSKQRREGGYRFKAQGYSEAGEDLSLQKSVRRAIVSFESSPRKQFHESFSSGLKFARRGKDPRKNARPKQNQQYKKSFGVGFQYTTELSRFMARTQ